MCFSFKKFKIASVCDSIFLNILCPCLLFESLLSIVVLMFSGFIVSSAGLTSLVSAAAGPVSRVLCPSADSALGRKMVPIKRPLPQRVGVPIFHTTYLLTLNNKYIMKVWSVSF